MQLRASWKTFSFDMSFNLLYTIFVGRNEHLEWGWAFSQSIKRRKRKVMSCRFLLSLMERKVAYALQRKLIKESVLIGSLSDKCHKVFDWLSAETQRDSILVLEAIWRWWFFCWCISSLFRDEFWNFISHTSQFWSLYETRGMSLVVVNAWHS